MRSRYTIGYNNSASEGLAIVEVFGVSGYALVLTPRWSCPPRASTRRGGVRRGGRHCRALCRCKWVL